jgi:hypothetical protein
VRRLRRLGSCAPGHAMALLLGALPRAFLGAAIQLSRHLNTSQPRCKRPVLPALRVG